MSCGKLLSMALCYLGYIKNLEENSLNEWQDIFLILF